VQAPVRREPVRVELRHADYNGDGFVSLAEAHGYARTEFARDDWDRNGILDWREQHAADTLAREGRGRDSVVTLADYDNSMRREFYSLDRNRDGYLSRYELGANVPAAPGVSFSWHWHS